MQRQHTSSSWRLRERAFLSRALFFPALFSRQSYIRTSLPDKNTGNLFWGLVEDVKSQNKKKDSDTWVTPNSNTHTACVHTDLQRAEEEEAKWRLLPVPLGHLLTFSLDFSKFGLRCQLCDAFHIDAFKEYSSLGGKQKAELGLEGKTPAPTHAAQSMLLISKQTLPCFESLCGDNRYKDLLSVFMTSFQHPPHPFCSSASASTGCDSTDDSPQTPRAS